MSATLGQDLSDLDRATERVGDLIAGVAVDGWGAPTPCGDWDVRTLVSHVVNGTLILTAPVTGAPAPDWESDNLGSDPAAAYDAATTAFRAAMSEPGVLDATYASILGDEPGSALVRMRISELVAHGWDLARALGRPTDVTPDLAEQVLAFWQQGLDGAPRDGMPFGEQAEARPEAAAADRLAAYLGRAG